MRRTAPRGAALLLGLAVLVGASPAVLRGQPAELLARPEHFEKSRTVDALHYKLVFVFDDANKSYRGENLVRIASLRDGLESCVLDAEGFTVTAVTDAAGRPLAFSQEAKTLTVTWPEPLAYGERAEFMVGFFQKDPETGMKFIAAAADHPAQINTYSWPEDAHHWFPCFDDPNDKVTDEVIATVRSDFKVLSNGRLEGVRDGPGSGVKTWHWTQDKPHPAYGIMLAAGPYEVIRDSLGALPVDYWVYPKDAADAPRSFAKTPKMIDFYGRVFGFPYPWAKYDQVCVAGYGGGMEATTATILGRSTIHDARADQDFSSDGLVAHELAHMWWGDLVTERSWPDVWISESFATYAEYLFTRFDRGEDEGAWNLEEKKRAYLEEARTRYIRPIVFNRYNDPWEIMDAHSYPKGAAVLHMLRFVMGDEAFFRTLTRFLERFAFKNADTHDLMTVVKDTTGMNLDGFFDEWIYKPGHPVFEVASDWDAGAKRLRLTVRQVQDFSKGIPVYDIPVTIGLTAGGRDLDKTVRLTKKEETFSFDLPAKPDLVRFDKGNWLLKEVRFEKPADELIYALKHDDAVGRRWAAGELARSAGAPGVAAELEEAASADPFWAVREASVEALAASPDIAGYRSFFIDRTGDAVSRVRAAAVRALGRTGELELRAFFLHLYPKESSYVVQAAILEALGAIGARDQIEFLKQTSALPSPRNILRRAAEAAIKRLEAAPERTDAGPKRKAGRCP